MLCVILSQYIPLRFSPLIRQKLGKIKNGTKAQFIPPNMPPKSFAARNMEGRKHDATGKGYKVGNKECTANAQSEPQALLAFAR